MTSPARSILVDSNIIVYAINRDSPKHAAAQAFLRHNLGNLVVAHQNIFESLRILTHPKFPRALSTVDALQAVEGITQACQIIAPDETSRHLAVRLIRQACLGSNQVFDAYLAATAMSAGIETIATDNTKDFKKLQTNLKLVNPFKAGS